MVIPDKIKEKPHINLECKLFGTEMTKYLQMWKQNIRNRWKQAIIGVGTLPMSHIRSSNQEIEQFV